MESGMVEDAGAGRGRTEATAVIALALAILSLIVPVLPALAALVMAALAASVIRDSGGGLSGLGLVRAARVVAALGLVISAVGLTVVVLLVRDGTIHLPDLGEPPAASPSGSGGSSPGFVPASSTVASNATPSAGEVDLASLGTGACFDDRGSYDRRGTVERADCGKPHDYEIFAVAELGGGDRYPGDREVERRSDQRCAALFPSYVGVPLDSSELGYVMYMPTSDAWAEGDRAVLCTLVGPEGYRLVGSMEHSRR